MKLGYSLLWSEIIEAKDLDYDLTLALQIVCPACREPMTKKVRQRGEGLDIHYLSHRPVPDGSDTELLALQERCELRVASFAKTDTDAIRLEGRGQTLEAFLAVLRERVFAAMSPLDAERGRGYKDATLACERSPIFRQVFSHFQRPHRQIRGDVYIGAPNWVAKNAAIITEVTGISINDDLLAVSQKFAEDILGHLRTPHSVPNLRLVAAAGAVTAVFRDGPTLFRGKENFAAALVDEVAAAGGVRSYGEFFGEAGVFEEKVAFALLQPIVLDRPRREFDATLRKVTDVISGGFPPMSRLQRIRISDEAALDLVSVKIERMVRQIVGMLPFSDLYDQAAKMVRASPEVGA